MIGRREFITLLGGAAATWPMAARAQQSGMPVVGFLGATSSETNADFLRPFRQALREAGYVEGQNVVIESRSAEGQIERLPALAAELAQRQVSVLATVGNAAALAAKAATTTIPIVFQVGDDPARLGLVASLARPGGNLTGINFFSGELAAKRLEILRVLVPGAVRVAVLVNQANPVAETVLRDVEAAARAMGLRIQVNNSGTIDEIDTAFRTFMRDRPDALLVAPDPLFHARRVQLALLAAQYRMPAVYSLRDFVEAGGLMSYGAKFSDTLRQAGVYVGRILKGEKPTDLAVVQSTKFEFVINAQTAKMLGITVPDKLLALADEVIE